jgi:hypothetical protein
LRATQKDRAGRVGVEKYRLGVPGGVAIIQIESKKTVLWEGETSIDWLGDCCGRTGFRKNAWLLGGFSVAPEIEVQEARPCRGVGGDIQLGV